MSENYKEREVRCYFGILNIKGLMDTDNKVVGDIEDYGEVRLPLFSHQTYKIKTTFNRNLQYSDTLVQTINEQGYQVLIPKKTTHYGNLHFNDSSNPYQGKYYQKKFRRQVLWDFGDGTKIEGYSAEHSYKKPGRYKITCTFFDINRQAWVNNYCIYVIVKEVLPTELRFVTDKTVSQIKCSKIQKIAELEALISNTVNKDLDVNVKRIFTAEQYDNNNEEINNKFHAIAEGPMRYMRKNWLFLQNTQTLYYNSDRIYMNSIEPTDVFHPKYQDLYGKFYYNEVENTIDFSFYQIIPFKNIDNKLKTIRIIDPNKRILSEIKDEIVESTKEYTITQLYVKEALPQGCIYVGKRAFFDIFYKNDFVSNEDNVISIFYDLETENITGELKSAPNYLNINPLGMNVRIVNNDLGKVKLGLSLDGFVRKVEDSDDFINPTNENTYIDPHLYNSLIKGIDIDTYMFPYIPYDSITKIEGTEIQIGGNDGFVPFNDAYYIPKDIKIDIEVSRTLHSKSGNSSFINSGIVLDDDGNIIDFGKGGTMESVFDWLYRIPIILRDYVHLEFNTRLSVIGNYNISPIKLSPVLKKVPLLDTTQVEIPREIQNKIDIDRLLDVYMAHPMFDETPELRFMFKTILGNNLLNSLMTRSKNFLDDTANVKTCYLSNLISMLKMMGEDVTQYEKTAFEGINDLKNFVRLLSINHADLVGHVIDEDLDINIKGDSKGKNVGAEIKIKDILQLNDNENSQFLGRIVNVKRDGSTKWSSLNLQGSDYTKDGLELLVHDRYTHEVKKVNFMNMQKSRIHNKLTPSSKVSISDYDVDWDWNLLLPDKFTSAKKKQKEYADLMKSGTFGNYSTSRRQFIANEHERMKQICADMIDGYYSFHLLDPRRQTKRVGNFIDDMYITDRIQNLKSWEEVWGITHEVLMKILYDNAKLYNNRTFNVIENDGTIQDEDVENYITEGEIYLTKQYNQAEITYDLYVNGVSTSSTPIEGSVVVSGTILGAGKNILTVNVENGIVDNYFTFTNYEAPRSFDIVVKQNGEIVTRTEKYYLIGENVQGFVEVTLKGTVAQPKIDVFSEVHFIDKRVQPINVIIETHEKARFYTNLKRQDVQLGAIEYGLVDCSDIDRPNKKFDVSLRWDKTPQIGYNRVYINIDYDMGDLEYVQTNGLHNGVYAKGYLKSFRDYPTNVIIDNDGTIRFEEEQLVFDLSNTGNVLVPTDETTKYQKGNMWLKMEGNVMATENVPTLHCWTYKDNNVVTRLLTDIGGYSFKVTKGKKDCSFIVDGEDGFEQGYYFVVVGKGYSAFTPCLYRTYSIKEEVYVYDSNDVCVARQYTNRRNIRLSVDEYGRITQDSYVNYYNGRDREYTVTSSGEEIQTTIDIPSDKYKINGDLYIEVDGKYYSLGGYDLSVSK